MPSKSPNPTNTQGTILHTRMAFINLIEYTQSAKMASFVICWYVVNDLQRTPNIFRVKTLIDLTLFVLEGGGGRFLNFLKFLLYFSWFSYWINDWPLTNKIFFCDLQMEFRRLNYRSFFPIEKPKFSPPRNVLSKPIQISNFWWKEYEKMVWIAEKRLDWRFYTEIWKE